MDSCRLVAKSWTLQGLASGVGQRSSPESGAVDELGGLVVEVLLKRGSYPEKDKGQGSVPVLTRSTGGHDGRFELAMKTFHRSIGLRVVTGGPEAANAQQRHDLVPHAGLKLAAVV